MIVIRLIELLMLRNGMATYLVNVSSVSVRETVNICVKNAVLSLVINIKAQLK